MTYVYKLINSPLGELKLVANTQGLVAILWENDTPGRIPLRLLKEEPTNSVLLDTERQLQAYFAGALQQFSVPLAAIGTPFQKQVWRALTRIPFGETRSYQQIAQQIDNPKAVRAVGAANRCNPISIIVPCHRVIGANGHLTGFAGGLEAKSYLLNIEKSWARNANIS